MSDCKTEERLRIDQVLSNLSDAFLSANKDDFFTALARIQEAEIIIRAILKQREIDSSRG